MTILLCRYCNHRHDIWTECDEHKAEMRKQYGHLRRGKVIEAPPGWRILPFGEVVPQVHREAIEIDGRLTWCPPRRQRSTMTAMTARVWGAVRAYGVLV